MNPFASAGEASPERREASGVWLVGVRPGGENHPPTEAVQQDHLGGWKPGLWKRSAGPETGRQAG